nr:putative ribonuclease H-like domain-containing protein [Tanacetum cinerariifolium]
MLYGIPTASLDLSKVTITLQAKALDLSFRIQQVYLQHKHHALWEVIEFGDSYKAPPKETAKDKGLAGKVFASKKKKGRTVAITAEDMQKTKNDVKARTTLLLALPDEHQFRFIKYDSAKELEEAILKTFGGNEATKKTKKNYTDVAAASLSYDTVFSFIATQLNGSQIKYEDVSQIDNDNTEEMDIKWILTLLSMRADRWVILLESADHQGVKTEGRERESYKKDPKVEEPSPKAMIAIDGTGWDWSYMAEEDEASKNYALVANEEEVQTKYALMAKSSSSSDNENKLEEVKKEKERIDIKIEKFENASKDLDRLLKSQKLDKDKKGVGFNEYCAVPPPPAQVYSPPKKDLSWMGLPEFVDDTIIDYTRPTPRGSSGNVNPMIKFVKESGCPNATKVTNTKNARKPTVKYAKIFDHLEFNCKHDIWVDKGKIWTRVNHAQDNMKYASTHKSMTPRAVLLKSGTKPIAINRPFSTTRPTLNSAQPKMTSFVKTAHLNVKRPFERKSAAKNKVWVPTVRQKIPTVGSKVLAAKPTVAADKGNKGKAVKASTRWIWKPKQNSSGQGLNFNGVSLTFKKYQYIDTQGKLKGKIIDKGSIKAGKDFKLVDDTHVLLRTPRQQNMYTIDLKNVVPHKNLSCLIAQASVDESMLWHRRFGHLNFKTMNKLVRSSFENDHYCVACLKGKQHKPTCKSKLVNPVSKPLYTLHMDLFIPTSVSSLNHKWYCLVVTDDFSRFSWTFFSKSKDETSRIVRNFITEIENLKNLNVKIIRSDNGSEFRNKEMDEFCSRKGITRDFSNARTPQQNGVAKRRNWTLIEAARTMLADAKLLVTFWAEAINTACYVQNRVLVIKPHNKIPYELFNEISTAIGFLRPFGCHVMILNTLDHLGKFNTKGDEGYFVGYSLSSKAFRVFNKRTKKIEENLHVDFLENRSIEKGTGPDWLFDIDTLTNFMNYVPVVVAGTSSTNISGIKEDVHQAVKEKESPLIFIALLNWFHVAQMATSNEAAKKDDAIPDNNAPQKEQEEVNEDKEVPKSSRNSNPTASTKVSSNDSFELASSSTVETKVLTVSTHVPTCSLFVPLVTLSVPKIISRGGSIHPEPLSLGNDMSFENRLEDFFGDTSDAVSLNDVEADLSNVETATQVSLTPTDSASFHPF